MGAAKPPFIKTLRWHALRGDRLLHAGAGPAQVAIELALLDQALEGLQADELRIGAELGRQVRERLHLAVQRVDRVVERADRLVVGRQRLVSREVYAVRAL